MDERYPSGGGAEPTRKSRRRPGSFVIRLTFAQSLRMLRLMLVIDLLVMVAFMGILLAGIELTTAELVQMPVNEWSAAEQFVPGLELSAEQEIRGGVALHRQIERRIGAVPDAARRLDVLPAPGEPFLLQRWEVRFVYTISAPVDEALYVAAVWDVTAPLRMFAWSMLLILTVETLLLISNTAGARRAIRNTLAPIQQLTAAARNMSVAQPKHPAEQPVHAQPPVRTQYAGRAQAERPKPHRAPDEKEFSGTIDALNRITAGKLDARIPVEGERQELRGLASAINSMLERVDNAYSSQLRFVSDASHELRTPIAVLQGYANMLDRWGKEDPAVLQESIEAIKAESEGMKVLVEQLLFLARGDNNTIALQVHPLSAAELVEDAVRDARMIDSAHEFEADIAPDLVLQGDNGLLKQALRIFVDNAVKYSPDGGKIRVQAAREGTWLRLSVTDNGIGIPEEDLPHVFERFFRSDESRARATGGTGLGLSIAQWIVERHGGHLEIVSREEIGTRMTMVLPVSDGDAGGQDADKSVRLEKI